MATNNGTATTWPVLRVTGPGRLYQMVNYTTGDKIYFDNLVLNSGEEVVLDLRPGKKTFVSSFRGNIIHTIRPDSDVATFALAPGENDVSILIDDATAAGALLWAERHWSVDGGGS
jgi:hypothetical protein